MQARPIINFLRISEVILLFSLLAVLAGCQTTQGNGDSRGEFSPSEIPLSAVREYLSSSSLSAMVTEELFAESLDRGILSSRSPEELLSDIESVADARGRVLSDISYYPMRRGLLEVTGGVLAQEFLVLKISYYNGIPGEDASVAELSRRLRELRVRHPELPGGSAEKILQELDSLSKEGSIPSEGTK